MEKWRCLALGDVLKLEYGKPLPKGRRSADGTFPAYGANGVKCHTNDVYCKKASIVVGRKGSAGELNLVEGGFWPLDVTYFVVTDERKYHLKFLYYLLSRLNLPSLAKGVKPGLNRNDVYSIEQQFPPLSEQQRIATVLDEAFASIAKATSNVEKNLTNARELFESQLEISQGLTSGAPTVPLADLVCAGRVITYGVIKLGQEVPDGVPCLRTSNVRRLRIEISGMKRISVSLSNDFKRTILEGGEVLVNVRGTLGGVAVVPDSMAGWNVSREVAVVPVNHSLATPNYLAFCIARKSSQEWLTGVVKGVAYRGINIADLRTLPILVPSLEIQQQVVSQVRDAQRLCESLENKAAEKLNLLSDLKQSVLENAFSCDLTTESTAVDRTLSEAGL